MPVFSPGHSELKQKLAIVTTVGQMAEVARLDVAICSRHGGEEATTPNSALEAVFDP